mmetsp:Transcript_123610/g.357523  ORF Transcript_123610/g.357523 Transcript_123610/m.357523 type:complete len:550 (-) Transcript_123610:273-1922(-)
MADASAIEASLFSEKCKKFGLLGAGLVQDSMMTLRLAEAAKIALPAQAVTGGTPETLSSLSRPPVTLEPGATLNGKTSSAVLEPSAAVNGKTLPVALEASATVDGKTLTRAQILEILAETVRVQGAVQRQVSALARQVAKERSEKKQRKPMSFMDGHKKILGLNLPKEPLEAHGLTEQSFQKLLMHFEEDEEVMAAAQKLLHPSGKGDPVRAASITMDRIIEIHKFMVNEMQKVLQEFLDFPQDVRRSFTGKGCETTAELLVSVAVEEKLGVHCEDVEQAVVRYEEALQGHPEFMRYTDQLSNMMQHLLGAAQPRVQKAEFLHLLNHMSDSAKKAKGFSKKLCEDYRTKACSIGEAYDRFDEFTEQAAQAAQQAEEMPELSAVELQLCYDEYKEDEEVKRVWEQSGVETSLLMQTWMNLATPGAGSSAGTPKSPTDSKGKRLKSSEVVEMQEFMVDEMKRLTQQVMMSHRDEPGRSWKAEVTIQMVQAMASAAAERRYGVTAEGMTLAGFQHAHILQKNERFARASEKQQDILMMLARFCGHDPASSGS